MQNTQSNLILRPLHDDADGGLADRQCFAAFNAACNTPSEGATCACLLHHHPETSLNDYWVVEDTTTGEIVSSTCLLPWTCHFAGIDLRVAQLEMVLTHPDYRGRGLVRRQMDNFEQAVKARGYDLSIIWGIPYYYRQFGYAYAVDGDIRESLPTWKIPPSPDDSATRLKLRPAMAADIPFLSEKHGEMTATLDFYARRSPAYWRYLIEAAHHPIQIIEKDGQAAGYVTLSRPPDSPETPVILECGLPNSADCLALLQTLKTEARQQILIGWPQQTPLVTLARSLGSQTVRGGQWLIRFPDVAQFLGKLGPAFEQRLLAGWQGYSGAVSINLFRQAYRLRFERGKLAGVDSLGFVDSSMGADPGDLLIPPDAFVRLVMGYRRLEDLFDAWPDILVKPEMMGLIEALFPPLSSYLCTPYHFLEG